MTLNEDITFFAETTFRNLRKRFGIRADDRRRHMYVIGKTGMGKSEMLSNMIIQDIQRGNGVAVVDPHGELAEKMLDYVPAHRVNDVVYVNPSDIDFPIAFNVMEKIDIEHRHLVASGMMGVFKKIWPDVWSARMEYILNNAILALLEYPGSTILGINRMLSDKEYRSKIVDKITDPVVKAFWVTEFAHYSARLESEATASIQNKIGQFISNPLIRNIVGQVRSKIDMREVIDTKKILIVNLSKGRVGEDNSRLLGAMLVTKLQLAAMSRVDIPEEERQDFYLYVDEFQNFATDSFANILSEARKYRLSLIMAHQYIAQIGVGDDTKVRDAVFGNVGTMVCFRIGAEDAEFLEREFEPDFMATDLVNLPKYQIYLKLMINGVTNRGFSAATLVPFERPEESFREKIIKVSRERYGTPRSSIEEKVGRWWSGVMTAGALKGGGGVPGSFPPQEPPQLFEAACANCGKRTYVTFEPDGKRPVYCKKCLKQKQQEMAARTMAPKAEGSSFQGGQTPIQQEDRIQNYNAPQGQAKEFPVPLFPPRSGSPPRSAWSGGRSVFLPPKPIERLAPSFAPRNDSFPPQSERGEVHPARVLPDLPENRFERERKVIVSPFRRKDIADVRQDRPAPVPPLVRRVSPQSMGKDDLRISSNQSRFRAASFNAEESEEIAPVPTISLAAALSAESSTFKRVPDKKINTTFRNPQKNFERRRIIVRDPVALRRTLKEVLAQHKLDTSSFKEEPKKEFEAPVSIEGESKKLEPQDFSERKTNDFESPALPLRETAKRNVNNNYESFPPHRENSLENRESTDEEEKKEGILTSGETITF